MSESSKLTENNKKENEQEILSIPQEESTNSNDSCENKKILCDFIIKEKIGEGTFSTVNLAINRQTGEKVAIKIMEKSKLINKEDKVRLDREIEVLKKLRHPNIVHLYSVIEAEDKIYLIMQYIPGKELFDYIVMKKKLSEKEACIFFQQLISGIEYLHKIKYIHRDIKPENLLIKEDTKELTIVDFGLTNNYTNSKKNLLSSSCGSPSYAAPEMLNGEKYHGPPVDIWSCGIVLYAMLCGYLPFEDENNNNDVLYDKICKGKFIIPNHVSEKARDLLNKIIETDPKKRLNIYQIKNHPWFSLYNNNGKLMISDGLNLSKYIIPIDEEIVHSMSKEYNINEETIRVSILSNKHNDISTIYYLILNKKIKNKKKTEADIKSNLFKKYCDNKNNLLKTYNNDINKVLNERKNGYKNNSEDSNNKAKSKEDNLSEKKRISKKIKRYFSPEEKIKMFQLNKKLNETEANINKNQKLFNLNGGNPEMESNINDIEIIKKENYRIFKKKYKGKPVDNQKSFNKNKNINNRLNTETNKLNYITNTSIKEKKNNNMENKNINNNIFINYSNNKKCITTKEQKFKTPYKDITNRTDYLKIKKINQNEQSERFSSIGKKKFRINTINEEQEVSKKHSLTNYKKLSNNYNSKTINKNIFNENLKRRIDISRKRKYNFITSKNSEILQKTQDYKYSQSQNIGDSLLNINKRSNCYEPFDLSLLYFKPKKLMEEKLKFILDKYKMKYRLINKDKFIIENKKDNITLSLKLERLKEINENEEEDMIHKKLSVIKLKRLNGGYENNFKTFEKIIYKIN